MTLPPPPGQTCEVDINECVKSPCRHGASCQNTNGGYRCHCQAGYTGRNCETDIDDCRPSEWPARLPASETGRPGGMEVALAGCRGALAIPAVTPREATRPVQVGVAGRAPGWCWEVAAGVDRVACFRAVLGGSGAGLPGIKPARHLPVGSQELLPQRGATLGPTRPLSLHSCPSPDPCHNGGSCTDGVNAAFCDCLPGFQGAFCEEDINECASNPCRHGANCTDCVASYTCTCPPGFSGIHCENNTPDCTERWVAQQVSCARTMRGNGPSGPCTGSGGLAPGQASTRHAELAEQSGTCSCPAGRLVGGHGQVARQEPGTLAV